MANVHDHGQDPSKRGLTGSYHQRTYGTVKEDFSHSLSPKRDAKVLIHEVKPTDTLQGIAVKYDTTVDLIRRLNKLGYSESVQTRAVLEVPLPSEQGSSEGGATAKPRPDGGGRQEVGAMAKEGEEASKDYLERSPQSILNSADEELEQAKKFVAKLAKKHPVATSSTTPAVATVSVRSPPPEGYNRPTEELPRPDSKNRVSRPTTDSEHERRDKLESTMFEL